MTGDTDVSLTDEELRILYSTHKLTSPELFYIMSTQLKLYMAGATQLIEISDDVKRLLDSRRHEDNSYNYLLRRLLISSECEHRVGGSWCRDDTTEKDRKRGKIPKNVRKKARE